MEEGKEWVMGCSGQSSRQESVGHFPGRTVGQFQLNEVGKSEQEEQRPERQPQQELVAGKLLRLGALSEIRPAGTGPQQTETPSPQLSGERAAEPPPGATSAKPIPSLGQCRGEKTEPSCLSREQS